MRRYIVVFALIATLGGCADRAARLTPVLEHWRQTPLQSAPGFLAARVLAPVVVRATPAGRPMVRLGVRTRFGSARVLAIVGRHGGWLETLTPELGNVRRGWVALGPRLALSRIPQMIVVELGRRRLTLRRGRRTLLTAAVGVGARATPTPQGRFAVTDRLLIAGRTPYGCCALALSARQPDLPQDWPGGDRIAIHGTSEPATIGQAVTTGCLRAADGVVRRLVDEVALGTPVIVRP